MWLRDKPFFQNRCSISKDVTLWPFPMRTMVASAYLDGRLGEIEGKDALSLIKLDKPVNELKAVTTEASNSVTGRPYPLRFLLMDAMQ